MSGWYNRAGERVDMIEVDRLLSDPAYKRVARTEVISASNPAVMHTVSTVWLGLDHNYIGGPPLIFESMVFSDSMAEDMCRRYSTEVEAFAGHAEIVAAVAAVTPDDVVADV